MDLFHDAIYCCVKYSIIEDQDAIFKTYNKKCCSKCKWLNIVLDVNFITLNIIKFDVSHIP